MIKHLTLSQFRNISEMQLQPAAGINMLLGDNGSGKTSVLEALFLLAMGRSFRSRSLKHLVQHQQQQLQVFARCSDNTPVGLQYHLTQGLQIRLNNAPLRRLSELASQLPVQYIPANCHQFFELGPRFRRQLVDWGLFHVEPGFNHHWQSYRKALQHRNALLKKFNHEQLQFWNQALVKHGELLSQMRQNYLDKLRDAFVLLFAEICPDYQSAEITVRYSAGWQKNEQLQQVLDRNLERDRLLGYTRSGAHACDWSLRINDADPAELLSRGQQKLFYLAISLAQVQQLMTTRQDPGLLLIDDLSSELDQQHQTLVIELLRTLPVQCFINSTNYDLQPMLVSGAKDRVFHVKQGQLLPIVS